MTERECERASSTLVERGATTTTTAAPIREEGLAGLEMEIEAKQRNQRNRRRERAQRILAQRESLATAKQQQHHHQQQQQQQQQTTRQRANDEEDSHSGEDEEPAAGLGLGLARSGHPRDSHSRPPRPPRPPRPRKKSSLAAANQKEPPFEEDIIDGFAILAFRTYEELEVRETRISSITERPITSPRAIVNRKTRSKYICRYKS